MRLRRSISLLLVGALFAGSGAHAAKSYEAWERFQRAQWTTVHTLALVPPEVLSGLKSRLGDDPRIADVGQPFEARRLVLAGHAAADWFIVYEQGGRGHHLVFVDFETLPRVRPVLFATGSVNGSQLDLPALTHALHAGSMKWGDPDAVRYD
jgi:hypothetical protein